MKNLLRGTKRRLAMVIRLLLLAVVVGLPGAADELLPVTVEVVDEGTGKPVAAFSYRARYRAPGQVSPEVETWTKVESASGSFIVQAPRACRLSVEFRWIDAKAGTELRDEFIIRSSDDPRRVVMKLKRGATVHGTVLDAGTGKAVAGATVVPVVVSLKRDEAQQATTDKDGHYELRGVDLEQGVWVSHPDYAPHESKLDVDKPEESRFDRFLTPLPANTNLQGTVRDPDGNPLEDVTIQGSDGHSAQTARDGTYAVRDAGRHLTYKKEGYIEKEVHGDALKAGQVVVLERRYPLAGQVSRPDGRPVESFSFEVSPNPSANPWNWTHMPITVKDRQGRFSIGNDRSGRAWVGVRAEGFAAWEGWADVAGESKPLIVRLDPGVAASGKVVLPVGARGEVQGTLVPRRITLSEWESGSGSSAKEFGTLTSTVGVDGGLRFDHVRPDRYILKLAGPDVTTKELAFDVPAEGFDLGTIRLAIAGRGRIEGCVFRSAEHGGGAWAFANGYARGPDFRKDDMVEFLSDEDGRFSADGVPEGLVKVGFPYHVFDVINADEWVVQVLAGQTTQVHLLDPSESRPLAIEFRIGDGSKEQYGSGTGLGARRGVENVTTREPMLRVELTPRSQKPLSFVDPDWEELDAQRRIVHSDVTPGEYRLRVIDWLGSSDFEEGLLAEQDIAVPTGERMPVRFSLGAGCITGRVLGSDDLLDRIEVIAQPRAGKGPARRARADTDGNFCVRYLDPGDYTVFAHDPKAGWLRVENVAVASNAVDVGGHRLAPGGTILGSIAFPRPCAVPDEVVAIGPGGVVLRLPFEVFSSFDRFELDGLWPGVWAITVRSLGDVLATTTAEVVGTEKVRVDLATSIKQGP
ncbi:carboxypeptidase-like regulatory domain-containing protein [Paludisphaera borealis]|uniref:Carboxypeptidase regulatory-like domain-containing protein n=1 Tax=Paludisphaera borealis TaxID=1387353 RepID=A0A1U7CRQ3_9BACT|nr:carboxypeptidase-like regulatory domain-containing protein [Paludisphaera borealis]APW61612.1 hypothetical protein BSF38_03134 [Paludisphaera borealis]